MNESASLRAIPGPADAVLPQAQAGFLGVVMLDTRFPRPPGDVGHPATFRGAVRHLRVPGAFPREVVRSAPALRASGLQERFAEALRTDLLRLAAGSPLADTRFLLEEHSYLRQRLVALWVHLAVAIPILLAIWFGRFSAADEKRRPERD